MTNNSTSAVEGTVIDVSYLALEGIMRPLHNYLQITLMSISILLHVLGLYAVWKHKKHTTQNIILSALSTSELVHVSCYLLQYVFFVGGIHNPESVSEVRVKLWIMEPKVEVYRLFRCISAR